MSQLLVRSERVVLPDGMRPATIRIANGLIAGIGSHSDTAVGIPEMDVGSLVVLPGLVDTHVHINDPGRAEWEGFEHATKAAAAGGVTTLVDMPLNSIPATTSTTGFEAKRAAATGQCHVDVGFWGGLVPGNRLQLAPLAAAGVLGFKCFLSPSGVAEFEHVNEQDLRDALPELSRLNLPLLVHAELPALLKDPRDSLGAVSADPRRYSTWLRSRPPESERAAIDLLLRLAKEYQVRLHIVHLATPDALPDLAHARRDGVRVTVETCPHYLTFAAEEISGWRHVTQVRSANSRKRLPRRLMEWTRDERRRPDCHRSLSGAARPQGARHGKLPRRVGWHFVASVGSCRRMDRHARAGRASRTNSPMARQGTGTSCWARRLQRCDSSR